MANSIAISSSSTMRLPAAAGFGLAFLHCSTIQVGANAIGALFARVYERPPIGAAWHHDISAIGLYIDARTKLMCAVFEWLTCTHYIK